MSVASTTGALAEPPADTLPSNAVIRRAPSIIAARLPSALSYGRIVLISLAMPATSGAEADVPVNGEGEGTTNLAILPSSPSAANHRSEPKSKDSAAPHDG
ncbi:MAG: hypothetical protein ACR2LZ_13220 [Pyrinomonadaceae bacterium]